MSDPLLESEENKFKHFIFMNLPRFDAIEDKDEKAKDIVNAVKHYFTVVYKPSTEVEFEEAKKSQD